MKRAWAGWQKVGGWVKCSGPHPGLLHCASLTNERLEDVKKGKRWCSGIPECLATCCQAEDGSDGISGRGARVG